MTMRGSAVARWGVLVLRVLLLCTLAFGVARAQLDDGGGWDFDEEEEAAPTFLELASEQSADILLFAAFATLAMVSFLRKSVPLKYVTLAASVLYMGIYKSQLISIVNVFGVLAGGIAAFDVGAYAGEGFSLATLGRQLSVSLPPFVYSLGWYAFAAFTVVTTIVWGRLYCGRICAFGALTQLIDAVVPKRFQIEIPATLERRAGYIKYGILFGAIGLYLATNQIAFYRYIEPFWFFTFDATPVLWVMVGVLLVASIFVRNLRTCAT